MGTSKGAVSARVRFAQRLSQSAAALPARVPAKWVTAVPPSKNASDCPTPFQKRGGFAGARSREAGSRLSSEQERQFLLGEVILNG
jgi:hypothetical protein